MGNLVSFERLVVDKCEGVNANVQRSGHSPERGRFHSPSNLRRYHQLGQTEPFQRRHRSVVVVATRDRVKDAALIETTHSPFHPSPQAQVVPLKQRAFPNGIIEIPYYALYCRHTSLQTVA